MPDNQEPKTQLSLEDFEEQARERYGVPKPLWEAIKGQESGGDPNAVSPTGVRGRFMVTKRTAAQYSLDRDDPFHQAVAAAKNLREGYDRYAHLTDDNERWLAAAGYYYGGPDAVGSDGKLSTASKDNLSNPSAYVTKIAQRWKQYNDSQPIATPQQPAATPKPPAVATPAPQQSLRTISPGDMTGPLAPPNRTRPLTAQERRAGADESARIKATPDIARLVQDFESLKREGSVDAARSVAAQIKQRYGKWMEVGEGDGWPYVKSRIRGWNPVQSVTAPITTPSLEQRRAAFEQLPLSKQLTERALDAYARGGGQVSKMARQALGAGVGASEFLAGKPFQVADFPAWRQGEEERMRTLEERRQGRPSSFATDVGEGIVEAIPSAAAAIGGTMLTGGGAPAMMAIGGGMGAAGADWRDPKRAAAQTALGAVAPVVGGKVGSVIGGRVAERLASPAAQALARAGSELIGGGAGNVAASSAEQLAFEGRIDPREAAKQFIVGSALTAPGALGAARPGAPVGEVRPVRLPQLTAQEMSDIGIRRAIDRYTQAVDQINRSDAHPSQKAVLLAEARGAFQTERQAAGKAAQQPTQPATAPEAAPQAVAPQAPTLPPGVRIIRQGEPIPPRQPGQRQIPLDIEQPNGSVETVLVVAPGQMKKTMLRSMVEQALRPQPAQPQPVSAPETVAPQPPPAPSVAPARRQPPAIQFYPQQRVNGAILAPESSIAGRKLLPPGRPEDIPTEALPPQIYQDAVPTQRLPIPNAPETQELPIVKQWMQAENAPIAELPAVKRTGNEPEMARTTRDPLFNQAKQTLAEFGKESISILQRRLKIGYARAANLIEQIRAERAGVQEPTNRITEGEGAELPRGVSRPLEGQPVEISEQAMRTRSAADLKARGYIPLYRGTDQSGFRGVKSTKGGVYGDGTYFYTEAEPAKSHATYPGGGVITGFARPEDLQIRGNVAILRDPSKFIARGKIPLEDTTLSGRDWLTRTQRALDNAEVAISRRLQATDENIVRLRAQREALSRVKYDRQGEFTGDLRDQYDRLTAVIRDYDNARAPRELEPPPGQRPEKMTVPPAEERVARRAALQPKTGPMPETLTTGRKVTQESQLPPGLKASESFASREDARQGHFEQFNDEELVQEIRRLEDEQNKIVGGRSKLTPEQREANRFDLKVAVEMQKERRRLQEQIGIEPGQRIAPRTPARTFKKHPEVAAPPEAPPAKTGRKIQHSKFGELTEAPDQTNVRKGYLRVIDIAGHAHIIKNPRTKGEGNKEAAFVKASTGAIPAEAMPELQVKGAPPSPLAGRAVKTGPRVNYTIPPEAMPELGGKAPNIVQRMANLTRTPTSPIEITKLRAEFPQMSKADFDAQMEKLENDGRIVLHRYDNALLLSEADRNNLVKTDKGYFGAATFREGRGHIMGFGPGALQGLFGKRSQPKTNPSKADIESAGLGRTLGNIAKGAGNEMRTLMTALDFGAPGAQGIWFTLSHPLKGISSGGKMFRSLSRAQSDAIDTEIAFHPLRKLGEKAGLFLAVNERLRGNKAGGEEAYRGFLADVPGFRHFERTYRTYLDTLRMSVWESYVKSLSRRGITWENNPKAYKDAAAFINIGSGRGHLKKGGMLDKASDIMGAVAFAPRNLVANFQLIDPVRYARMDPATRKLALRDSLTAIGAMVGTAVLLRQAGVKVGFNPENDDFMQARWGNTRYDLTFGKKSNVQFLARLIAAGYRKATGEGSLPNKDALSVMKTFAQSKASPLASAALALGEGKTYKGKQFKDMSKGEIAWETGPWPILMKDLIDVDREEGKMGVVKTLPAVIGARVNTYPDRAKAAFLDVPSELREEQKRAGETRPFLTPRRAKNSTEKDETPGAFAARRAIASDWTTKYGMELISSDVYKSASTDEKKAAREYLKRTIAEQSGAKRPSLWLFAPGSILEVVRESERKKRQKAAAEALQ